MYGLAPVKYIQQTIMQLCVFDTSTAVRHVHHDMVCCMEMHCYLFLLWHLVYIETCIHYTVHVKYLTANLSHAIQCTHKFSGYACGSELHSEGSALHPPATVDEVYGTECLITVHPQPVTDHLPVSPNWVFGYHSQSVVSWRNASTMVCTIGAYREYV